MIKKLFFILIACAGLPGTSTGNTNIAGYLLKNQAVAHGVNSAPINYSIQSQKYVHGGITFVYPAHFFTTAPTIFLSVDLTGLPYHANTIVVPMATSNTASSTVVRVNKDITETIAECANNDCIVNIIAIGN